MLTLIIVVQHICVCMTGALSELGLVFQPTQIPARVAKYLSPPQFVFPNELG